MIVDPWYSVQWAAVRMYLEIITSNKLFYILKWTFNIEIEIPNLDTGDNDVPDYN